ncbi:MAG: hypothetical protein ABJB97_02100 [Acidobacteriota bacterium]
MKVSRLIVLTSALAMTATVTVNAQRPRAIDTSKDSRNGTAKVAPAPQTVKAKYEGGVFGYRKTMDGTLTFDDTNSRLLFRNKEKKDVFFIPYDAVTSAFADTQKRQPAAATVASHIPLIYALPAAFIKTKVRYLTVSYNDPDTRVSGITSFKLENKEILASVLKTLADKVGMTTRGEIYIRARPAEDSKPSTP